MDTVSLQEILTYLWIIVAVMLLIVLYHAIFITVNVRKIVRRIEDITAQVEAVILKPISMADEILKKVMELVEHKEKKPKKKKSS